MKKNRKVWSNDATKGSRKNLEILDYTSAGPGVCGCYSYYERQLKTTFFQVESDQTRKPSQNFFFKVKILVKVSKVLQKVSKLNPRISPPVPIF